MTIGDSLSVLRNKVLESCRHRVKAQLGQPLEERHSFAQLMGLGNDALIMVLSGFLNGTEEEETYTGDAGMSRE